MQGFRGTILRCIRKYFVMWNVQSHNVTRRSKNYPESGCLSQVPKTKKYRIFAPVIVLK